MEFKFFHTQSNAIILHDTLPPICIETVVSRKSQEVLYTKTLKSPPGVLDCFFKDLRCREAQEKHGWRRTKCKETDEFAQEDHT